MYGSVMDSERACCWNPLVDEYKIMQQQLIHFSREIMLDRFDHVIFSEYDAIVPI